MLKSAMDVSAKSFKTIITKPIIQIHPQPAQSSLNLKGLLLSDPFNTTALVFPKCSLFARGFSSYGSVGVSCLSTNPLFQIKYLFHK
jgi:hypothetical protein